MTYNTGKMKIGPNTKLRRINGVELKLNSVNMVEILFKGKSYNLNNQVLVLLDLFAHPTSLKEVMGKFSGNGPQHWIEVSNMVTVLYNSGILIEADNAKVVKDVKNDAYGAAAGQIFMLNDKKRTDYFINGINETVKKGDIVLDIGTGTGILAIAAARAGAKKVYAIETSSIADIAEEIIEMAGVTDKVEVIRGWSTTVDLPEKADVLVSEMLGNDPLDERILQIFKDAQKRLLKSSAKVLPGRLKVKCLQVSLSDDLLHNRILSNSDIENWLDWYNIDGNPLKKVQTPINNPMLNLTTKQGQKITIVSEPIQLADINLNSFDQTFIDNTVPTKKGKGANAVLLYFDAELGTSELSTHPKKADISNHWTTPVYYLPQLEKHKDGEEFTLSYTYNNSNKSEIHIL